MPAKGSTGTTRRAPLRSDRGVKLYAPTAAKPFFRVVTKGQVERTSAPVPVALMAEAETSKFDAARLDPVTARTRREADELFDQMVRWAKHQPVEVRLNCDNGLMTSRVSARRRQPWRLRSWSEASASRSAICPAATSLTTSTFAASSCGPGSPSETN